MNGSGELMVSQPVAEPVAAAYGWPAGLSDDEVLSRLLDLNRPRSAMSIGADARKEE